MTIKFNNIYIKDVATVAGKIENSGPISKYFDKTYSDFYMNEKTFEAGEVRMIEDSVSILLKKTNMKKDDIDLFISGDLINQITPSSYAASKLGINYIGMYAACATSCLEIITAASYLNNRNIHNCICNVSANNSGAERQYRNPVEYGTPKPATTTFTATGSASILVSDRESDIRVEAATIGKVVDYGVKDVYNMGAAMAPSACYTINKHLADLKRDISYYDLVLTGDLGKYGKSILKDLMKIEHNIDLKNYDDCGCILYDINNQNVYAGASGPTSSGLTLSYIISNMRKKKYKRVLLVATGALMSPTMMMQKNSIPAISHAVSLEVI